MNNKVSLAIMAKIKLLYESDDPGNAATNSFVSFNYPAIPYTSQDLTFDSQGGTVTPLEAKQAWADFSVLSNLVLPVNQVRSPSDRILWNEYGKMLQSEFVEVANRKLSAAETQELKAAKDLLYTTQTTTDIVTGETKLETVETEAYKAYQEYRDRHLETALKLNSERLTGEFTTDPALKQAWLSQKETLENAVAIAEQVWVTQGHKYAVEEAFADIERLEGGQPQVTWNEARFEFTSDEFKQTNPTTNGEFYPTTFLRPDFHQSDAQRGWTRLELTGSEVDTLSQKALETMPELAEALLGDSDTQADVEIANLSVELARVELYRPWLKDGLFNSPFWRWRFEQEQLSDGEAIPSGTCPAYTTAMIFARNLDVELKPSSAKNEVAIAKLKEGNLVTLGPMMLKQVPSSTSSGSVRTLQSATLDPNQTKFLRQLEVKSATGQIAIQSTQPLEDKPLFIKTLATARRAANQQTSASKGNKKGIFSPAIKLNVSSPQATFNQAKTFATQMVSNFIPIQRGVSVGSTRVVARRPATGGTAKRPSAADLAGVLAGKIKPRRPIVRDHRTGNRPVPKPGGNRVPSPRIPIPHKPDRPNEVVPIKRVPTGGYQGYVQAELPDGSLGRKLSGVSITFVKQHNHYTRIYRPQGQPDQTVTVQTDASGFYEVKLFPGNYRVTATKFGYQDYATGSSFFTLKGNTFQEGDIYLQKDQREEQIEDSFAGLQLIACISRKLPKSPNPNPNLQWE